MTDKNMGSSCREYRRTSLLGMLDAEGLSGFLWNLGWPSEGQPVTLSGFFCSGCSHLFRFS